MFDLLIITTTELWQTFLFQIIHVKIHVTSILRYEPKYVHVQPVSLYDDRSEMDSEI